MKPSIPGLSHTSVWINIKICKKCAFSRETKDVSLYCIFFLQSAWQRSVDLRAAPPRRQAEAGLRGRPLGARRLRHPLPPRHLLPLHPAHMERRECMMEIEMSTATVIRIYPARVWGRLSFATSFELPCSTSCWVLGWQCRYFAAPLVAANDRQPYCIKETVLSWPKWSICHWTTPAHSDILIMILNTLPMSLSKSTGKPVDTFHSGAWRAIFVWAH